MLYKRQGQHSGGDPDADGRAGRSATQHPPRQPSPPEPGSSASPPSGVPAPARRPGGRGSDADRRRAHAQSNQGAHHQRLVRRLRFARRQQRRPQARLTPPRALRNRRTPRPTLRCSTASLCTYDVVLARRAGQQIYCRYAMCGLGWRRLRRAFGRTASHPLVTCSRTGVRCWSRRWRRRTATTTRTRPTVSSTMGTTTLMIVSCLPADDALPAK
jgi:hypothetical protein